MFVDLWGNIPYAVGMNEKNDDENFYSDRSKWTDYVASRRDITHGQFRVGYFIASKVNAVDRCMWWNVDEIARALGVSNITVSNATKTLSYLGLMVVSKGSKGSHSYSLRMPFDPDADRLRHKPKPRAKPTRRKTPES